MFKLTTLFLALVAASYATPVVSVNVTLDGGLYTYAYHVEDSPEIRLFHLALEVTSNGQPQNAPLSWSAPTGFLISGSNNGGSPNLGYWDFYAITYAGSPLPLDFSLSSAYAPRLGRYQITFADHGVGQGLVGDITTPDYDGSLDEGTFPPFTFRHRKPRPSPPLSCSPAGRLGS